MCSSAYGPSRRGASHIDGISLRRPPIESLDVFIRTYGYPALFGGMVIEKFVPPMPGEPLLL